MQPTLDGHPHFGKVACEEVVPGDKYQLFRVSGLRNDFLQRVVRDLEKRLLGKGKGHG